MLIARLDNVSLFHGTHRIFEGLSITLKDGETIGLVGPNGAGKSTLLRLLAGVEQPDAGTIVLRGGIRTAWLPQEYAEGATATAIAEVIGGRVDLLAIEADLDAVEAALADPANASDM